MLVLGATALPGNHQHQLGPVPLRLVHKCTQTPMGFILSEAMQIDGTLDIRATAAESLKQPWLDLRQWRGHFWTRLLHWRNWNARRWEWLAR